MGSEEIPRHTAGTDEAPLRGFNFYPKDKMKPLQGFELERVMIKFTSYKDDQRDR